MHLLLFGPPGVGKGTQGARLAGELGIRVFVMGDILRDAVEAGTSLGAKASRYMDEGKLVPDDIVISMIEKRIAADENADGFLLDGFPRNAPQAEALNDMLSNNGISMDRVVFMEAPEALLIQRLAGRLTCRSCGFGFHRQYSPPREQGRCDRCGGELYQRDDDREDVIAERLAVYLQQTRPLLDYYSTSPAFRRVNGEGDMETVYKRLTKAVMN